MSKDSDDLGLQTLLAARQEVAPHLDQELLVQCYTIQKKYQFSDDRTISANAMERLIDAVVSRSSSEARKQP